MFLITVVLLSACMHNLQRDPVPCFRGKLVKRGVCGQRLVQLISPPAEIVHMAGHWTDSLSGKTYASVFTVANPCDFPAAIKEGEEFSFMLTTRKAGDCIQCYVYTAMPVEKNNILVGCPK